MCPDFSFRERHQGFNLIELMLVVSLLALLASLGGQNLGSIVQGAQTRSGVNDVHGAFKLARQQAVEQRTIVTLCVLDEDQACGNQWGSGPLVVFADPDNQRRITNPAQIIRRFELPDGVQMSSHPSHMPWHQYDLMGAPRRATGGHIRVCSAHDGQERARIIIAQAGRTRVERFSAPGDPCVE